MLEEHVGLVERIDGAEEAARRLYEKGCRVEEVVGLLRRAGGLVKERVRGYEKDAKKRGKAETLKGEKAETVKR